MQRGIRGRDGRRMIQMEKGKRGEDDNEDLAEEQGGE